MPDSGTAERGMHVAVVDDDASLCRSFSRLLRAAGLEPVTYPSAEAFLAESPRPRFDCLLLDVHLGGMSGIELSRRLSADGSAVPVIFITAQDDPEIRLQALADGCFGFFRKTDPGRLVVDAIQKTATLTGSPSLPGSPAGGTGTPVASEPRPGESKPH